MSVEIKVPALGESVSEATIAEWFKAEGERVKTDETVLVLETDKVSLEVYAPTTGTLSKVAASVGDQVSVGAVLGIISQTDQANGQAEDPSDSTDSSDSRTRDQKAGADCDVSASSKAEDPETTRAGIQIPEVKPDQALPLSPAVRKMIDEHGLDARQITGSGKAGRLTKGDVQNFLDQQVKPEPIESPAPSLSSAIPVPSDQVVSANNQEMRLERVKMTRLRRRIAERLKQAQNTAAILTTFNEVDMSQVMALRNAYKESFERKHGVRLGFMSFFVKSVLVALQEFPSVNAEIDGEDILYKNFYNIGVAVGSPQGLVVPVLKDADTMNFADIEKAISSFAIKARDGRLSLEDLAGGTFTISNGGIYGSMMSTPILNPPQSAILGMHKTQMRPMVVDGSIEARPVMYLALSYDHRIIDGREAVTFLSRIKNCIEDPQRILLDA